MNLDPRYYACSNRRDFVSSYPVADGYYMDGHTRTPRMVSQPNFSYGKPCEYTKSALGMADAGCTDCRHKQQQLKGTE
ncbi:MAG: hypothetical protein HHJ15_18065 [Rhodoferax sp.]|uniref:hypothetical protein n=1 Tax=Rhodoferax sp. TaxID=50421 RepID=UPI0018424DC1|nr:hypothetical protein [Rhodoferax sp.]NMM21828.1 hypothetical protein [Rhodoferax sp.]